MSGPALHRFEVDGHFYALDPESCFCFECDAISWDVLEHYPHTPVNRILALLEDKHPRVELEEVVGELEWLRSSKSIVQTPKVADLEKLYAPAGGLKKISLAWEGAGRTNPADALALLLGRSGVEKDIEFEFLCGARVKEPDKLAKITATWADAAALSGKRLSLSLRASAGALRDLSPALAGHAIDVVLTAAAPTEHAAALNKALDAGTLAALAKWAQALPKETQARIVLKPGHATFGGAAKALRDAGFSHIELDVAALFLSNKNTDAAAVFQSLRENAEYYAKALLKRDQFRLDPVAGIFLRVYQGTPLRRSDPAGTQEMAVDAAGKVYPSPNYFGSALHCMGSLGNGELDATLLAQFENAGSATTAACTQCWARNLCGGGSLAVHHALTGSTREPSPAWCEAQRSWLESAVAAFNQLSTAGVNFVQVYESLGRKPKVSLWQAAKVLINTPLGIRPLAEADAPLLAKWENWSESAYFLSHEAGLLVTNQYDREMDALHPQGFEQEFVITPSSGAPIGLLRIRPLSLDGAAMAWLYFHNPADYQSAATRRGFRNLLDLLPSQQSIKRLLTPCGPSDAGLPLFLQASGFERAGNQRQSLYLHGAYHDVQWYTLAFKGK